MIDKISHLGKFKDAYIQDNVNAQDEFTALAQPCFLLKNKNENN